MIADPLRPPETDAEPVGYSTTPLDVFVLAASVVALVLAILALLAFWRYTR